MANCFDDLQESRAFKHLVALLDMPTWAKVTSVQIEKAFLKIVTHFKPFECIEKLHPSNY